MFIFHRILLIFVIVTTVFGARFRRSSNIERKTFGNDPRGRCECGLFAVKTNNQVDKNPVIAKESVEIACNTEGANACEKLCVEVAKAAQNQGPTIVCESIRDIEHLNLRLFSRICQNPEWLYSGIQSIEHLCCKAGLPVPCPGQSKVPASLTGPPLADNENASAAVAALVHKQKITSISGTDNKFLDLTTDESIKI